MNARDAMVDSEIVDLNTRLCQIQEETELLAAQQHELQRQLRIVEKTARDLHEKILDEASDVRAEEWRLEQDPVHDTVDESSEESFPCRDVDELMKVRHFLERSSAAVPEIDGPGSHLLVVIDHHEARIFRADLLDSMPERIAPFDPYGIGRHLCDVQDDSDGQRKPERRSFYDAIAKTLRGAGQILIFGTGTGGSSAIEHLLAELKYFHTDVARHIIGSVAVDEHHLTEIQLLARARDFYSSAQGAAPVK